MPTAKPRRAGILELLDAKDPLKTPPFQRSFAWGPAEIDDYWNDLRRALDASGGSRDHFLGLAVLDDKSHIQDGQQRLVTTLLLSSVIYNAVERAKGSGSFDTQLAIDAAGAVTPALRHSPAARLQISLEDQDVLVERVGIQATLPESARRLKAARKRLDTHMRADLENRSSADAQLARLKRWGEYLRDGAYVVVLTVEPREAHNIFETVNTRGVQLSNGDLVKSHLIGRADDTNTAVGKWNQVTEALKDESGKYESDLESFLLHYFGSRYARTTKREFFADYRKATATLDSFDALDELVVSARLYRALVAPEASAAFWSAFGPGVQHSIELVNGLSLKQLRYVLLAVLRDLGSDQATAPRLKKQGSAIVGITAWSVRGLVDSRTGGGEAERTYIKAAEGIRDRSLSTVPQLRTFFRKMFSSDDEVFKRLFAQYPWDRANSHTRARAILIALERHAVGRRSALTPRGTLTVEHVLPQSPGEGEWSQFSDDDRASCTYDIGNLLLVDGPSGANNALGNREWAAKRSIIKNWGPQTPLTQQALRKLKWNPSVIAARRESLAAAAAEAWKA